MGLFLRFLSGASGETAVHVVARLSSHVFTVATPSHGRCGQRQRANAIHGRLPLLRHCPAPHQQTSFDAADPETLATTRLNEATLALVQRCTWFEDTPLVDACNLKFWIVFFYETIQFNFVRHEARTCLCCCMMPAKASDGRLVNLERALCEGTQACGPPRQSIVRWAARLAWTDAARTEFAAVPSALWQGYYSSSTTTL